MRSDLAAPSGHTCSRRYVKKLQTGPILAGFLMLSACAVPVASLTPAATNSLGIVTGVIANRSELGSRAITPLEIIEDSRCPANVRCIQAGTVRLKVSLQERRVNSEATLGLEQPARLEGAWLHLVEVCPPRVVPNRLSPLSYRFTFAITISADRPAVQVLCG